MRLSEAFFDTDAGLHKPFFPSKILVFGEYSVLCGSQALALPLAQFGGQWRFSNNLKKQYDLPQLAHYIAQQALPIDTAALTEALAQGLYFESNIPRGYGAGSSGALVAAIFECFGTEKMVNLTDIKRTLGLIEAYYHGASSGFDPLGSFVKQAIVQAVV